jgi:hypothetical protein
MFSLGGNIKPDEVFSSAVGLLLHFCKLCLNTLPDSQISRIFGHRTIAQYWGNILGGVPPNPITLSFVFAVIFV